MIFNCLQPHRGLRRVHGPLDGGRAHGLRGRRRAPPRRRRLRHLDLHAPVLRAGGGPLRALARQGRDRQRLPALGGPAAGAGGRAGGRVFKPSDTIKIFYVIFMTTITNYVIL